MASLHLSALATITLMVVLAFASATDLRCREIPNWLMGAGAVAGTVLAASSGRLLAALIAGVLAAAPFLAAALIRPEGMGMGDVKLAGVMGIFLGQSVWVALAIGLGLAGLTGALIAIGQRRTPSSTTLPLAPFLALGAGMLVAAGSGVLQ